MSAVSGPTAPADELCPGLGEAAAVAPKNMRAALERAVEALRGSQGVAHARAGLRRLLPAGAPSDPAAAGVLGLLAAAEGDADEAAEMFDRAAVLLPQGGWPLTLRASLHRARGRSDLARRDLDRALALAPHWRVFCLRAEVFSESGQVPEAIADINAALALTGPDESLFRRRAQFQLQRRDYEGARQSLDRAVALSQRSAQSLAARAELFTLTDRLALAQKDLDAAVRLAPEDLDLSLSRLRCLVLRRRRASALRTAASLERAGSPRAAAEARFCRGLIALQSGRRGRGQAEFESVMREWPQEDSLSQRARFYWVVSRVTAPEFRRRQAMSADVDKKARLYLCGLGIFPPYTASLDVLHSLSRCDVLFNNVAGPEVRQLLGEFCADVRPAAYQAWEDEPKWADAIFAELDKGRTVAFVTRGHPLVFGALAVELLRRCKRQGVAYQSFGSVSSIDHILARTAEGLGDHMAGIQAFDRPALEEAETLNTRQPLLACFYAGIDGRERVAGFRRSLERFYPGSHECRMFGPKYDSDPAVLRLENLEEAFPVIHPSLMLYLPPLKPGRKGRPG